jgi:hypothetical protein
MTINRNLSLLTPNVSATGTVNNAGLTNSSVTIGSTAISLGSTVTTFAGLTLASPTITGTVTAGGGVGTNGQVLTSTGSGVSWANGSFDSIVLNDISNQFNNTNCVFPLRLEQSNITSSNFTSSKNLEVIINGLKLSPYITQLTYPWLTPYDSFKGFKAVVTATSANLIIYNAPAIGDFASVTIINNSSSIQTRKYPYSATTIALGD